MVKVSFYTDFYFYFRFQTNYSCCCLPLNLRSYAQLNYGKVFFQIYYLFLIDFPDKLDLWHSIILFSASIPICHWSMFGFLDRPEPWPSINLFVRFLPPIQQPPSISSLFIWPRYNWGTIYGSACHWLNPCCWKFIDEDTNSLNWHNNYSTMTYIYNFKLIRLVVPVHALQCPTILDFKPCFINSSPPWRPKNLPHLISPQRPMLILIAAWGGACVGGASLKHGHCTDDNDCVNYLKVSGVNGGLKRTKWSKVQWY